MSQTILLIIIAFVLFDFFVSKVLGYLNFKTWNLPIPNELKDIYTQEEFEKAKNYAKDNRAVGMLTSVFSLVITLVLLYFYGFHTIDQWAKSISENNIIRGLIFWAIISIGNMIIALPFEVYSTFVIEQKYGFNKTTPKVFVLDKIKGLALGAIIGGGLYALLSFLYISLGDSFWWMAWLVISGFSLFMAAFYTSLLLPIFNKLTPLPDGELKTAIEQYAQKVAFPLTNIMVMDGSKRSAKANAFFSGIGNKKSIVLFDTLIEQLSQEEILAVLAHEVGHYKKKHIFQSIILSVLQTGIILFIFGIISNNPFMSEALGSQEKLFHLSLITFALLFSPISMITGVLMNMLSRKNEYEADDYAASTYNGESLISGLKKMTVKHLSNPQPHPLYIFVNYSHPTILQRIRNIRK